MMTAVANLGGFTHVRDEFERSFKSGVKRYGLTRSPMGATLIHLCSPDRNLTPDEIFDHTVPQIKGAAKLGIPVVRLQHFASAVAERRLTCCSTAFLAV